jgi:hypothetical protein
MEHNSAKSCNCPCSVRLISVRMVSAVIRGSSAGP